VEQRTALRIECLVAGVGVDELEEGVGRVCDVEGEDVTFDEVEVAALADLVVGVVVGAVRCEGCEVGQFGCDVEIDVADWFPSGWVVWGR